METEGQPPQGLRCPNGHEVEPGVRFCPECGAAVGEAAAGAASPSAKRNLVPWLVGADVVVVAAFAAFLLLGGGHRVEGSFSMFGSDCQRSGGHDDIGPGTSVTIRNESGSTIGTGSLGAGEGVSGGCAYPFAIDGVPDAKFYRVEVSHGGEVEYSLAEMESNEWTVIVSLEYAGS
jgi:hypothetical protein